MAKRIPAIKTAKYWFGKGFDDAADGTPKRSQQKEYLRGYREGKHYRETRMKYRNSRDRSEVRSPTRTSTEAETTGNKTITVTTGAGSRGATVRMNGAVKIYGRCLRIEAVKLVPHTYGGKRVAAGQRYFHDFTNKNATIYGMPDGSLRIVSKK